METTATILHADLDAFYASVEQLLDPSLRGKPIAVGGGVVLAASYEAKAFGISGGMSGRRARELCPQLIFVGGHFKEYQRLGDAAINVLNDFTPLVERISIDEAFADVAGCTHLFGPPAEIAVKVRRRVRAELGLPISIGVARTKHLAKIASQVAKPDGLVVVDPETETELPSRSACRADVGRRPGHQGAAGRAGRPYHWPTGEDAGMVAPTRGWPRGRRETCSAGVESRSTGNQDASSRALGWSPVGAWQEAAEVQVFRPTLRHLADRVATRLRAKSRPGRTVTVRVRFADLRSVTRSVTLDAPISATTSLAEIAEELVRTALADHPDEKTISLLAISVSHLERHWDVQLELPLGLEDEKRRPGTKRGMARWTADRAVDNIRDRFGWEAVEYGSALGLSRSVPDEFRELAEKDLLVSHEMPHGRPHFLHEVGLSKKSNRNVSIPPSKDRRSCHSDRCHLPLRQPTRQGGRADLGHNQSLEIVRACRYSAFEFIEVGDQTLCDQRHQIEAEFAIVVVKRDYSVLGNRQDIDTRNRDRRGGAGFVGREHPDLADHRAFSNLNPQLSQSDSSGCNQE